MPEGLVFSLLFPLLLLSRVSAQAKLNRTRNLSSLHDVLAGSDTWGPQTHAIPAVAVAIPENRPQEFRIESPGPQGGSMDDTISTKDLKSKLDHKSITVVETLAPDRYQQGHIPGAINIPPERVKELAPQLLPNKNAAIVTYCANTH